MTDIDIMSEFYDKLAQAIYGGAPPSAKEITTKLREQNLDNEFNIIAAQVNSDFATKNKDFLDKLLPKQYQNYWLLQLHPGLLYLSCNGSAAPFEQIFANQGWLTGEAQRCSEPKRWIETVQKAIVSLRRRELEWLESKNHLPSTLSLAQELQSRQLAKQALERGDGDWRTALSGWTHIVLLRHTNQLNDMRRRIIEFITELTRDIDSNTGLAYPFSASVEQIYSTFAFSKVPQMVETIVQDLRPHLISISSAKENPPAIKLVNSAIRQLNLNIEKPFSLDKLAKKVHVSPNHLARTFKKYTGKTTVQYLHAVRIGKAKRLLRETHDTIFSVALDCGFQSSEHFHRVFKKLTGTTPDKYRKGEE